MRVGKKQGRWQIDRVSGCGYFSWLNSFKVKHEREVKGMIGIVVTPDILFTRADVIPAVAEADAALFLMLNHKPKSVLHPGKNLAKVWWPPKMLSKRPKPCASYT